MAGKAPMERPQHSSGVLNSCDIEAQPVTPLTLCVAPEIGITTCKPITESGPNVERTTAIAHGEALCQTKTPPYDDDFYQHPWFCGLVLLLLTSTVANAALILQWATSYMYMEYFLGGALPSIGYLLAWFHVPPIVVYPFLFIRTGNSISTAEWLVQKVCSGESIQVQRKASIVVFIVAMLLAQLVILMQFYYLNHQ
jgi:hypothetical protein